MNYIGNFNTERTKLSPVSLANVKLKGYFGEIINKNIESIKKGFGSTIAELFIYLKNGTPLTDFHDRLAAESDVFKLMEGACYAYLYSKDEEINSLVEEHTNYILGLAQEDGFVLHPNKKRFDEKYYHDLYICGHFVEYAVAYYEVYNSDKVLNIAKKWVDTIIKAYKNNHSYFNKILLEHPEFEISLVRLYRATGEKKYLDFSITIAKRFEVTPLLKDCNTGNGRRHVVRTNYLFMGILEQYLETGDDEQYKYIESLINEIIDTRMYICGGVGNKELYPYKQYELPQTGNIAETCGSVSLSMLLWRMFQINPNPKYLDAMEIIFHNHLLGALNNDQDAIFYYNPIKSNNGERSGFDKQKRTKLPTVHGCSCCFPNIWRFFGQLPEYIFSVGDDAIYVNYLASAEADIDFHGEKVHIETISGFPTENYVTVKIDKKVKVKIKKPYFLEANDINQFYFEYKDGFYETDFIGESGLNFEKKVKLVASNSNVKENANQIAVTYGPHVYMVERPINEGPLDDLIIDITKPIEVKDNKLYAWFNYKIPKNTLYYEYKKPIMLELIPFNQIAEKDTECNWQIFFNIN